VVTIMNPKLSTVASLIAGTLLTSSAHPGEKPAYPIVHRHTGGDADALVNAYLVETANGVVAIDATMTVDESERLRADLVALRKPLLAVLVTHGHPDHYGGVTGLVANDSVPVIATRAVDTIIRRDDRAKDEALTRAGIRWATRRTFPTRVVADGESVTFDGVRFTVNDAGPGESEADSIWILDAPERAAFVGDLALNHVHAFLADGHSGEWMRKLRPLESRLRELGVTTVYTGHGEPGGLEMLEWTKEYVEAFRNAIHDLAAGRPTLTADQKTELSRRMADFLPGNRLSQFVARSADPVAAELARAATK
jgi:glyoxylase-like metal-dependent hydrolase (beta-lactamase superfamily II)